MADVNPLKMVDLGSGQGQLREMQAGDKIPGGLLPATDWTAETVSQAEAEAGAATTRRAWTAQRVRQAIVAWWNGATSAFGRGFVAAADAAAGRAALGLGTAATRTALGTTGALYSRDSILGAVSQSGGIPAGAIIERGSNVNGEFVRFADGTQICFAVRQSTVSWEPTGAVFLAKSTPWQFPASFASLKSFSAFSVSNAAHWGTTMNITNNTVVPDFYSALAGASLNYEFLRADGFWH